MNELTSIQRRRVEALHAAATMYQGQEVHIAVVLDAAAQFETFISMGKKTGRY